MRLLIVSMYFWPETFRINDLAQALVARGHQVTVLTGRPNYPGGAVYPEYRRDPAAFNDFEGVEVVRIPFLARGQGALRLALNYLAFVFSGLLFGPLRLRGRSFDAIFVYEVSPVTVALPAILLRRSQRAPLFLWVLDLWPDTLAALGVLRSPRLLALADRLVGWIYRQCDRILVPSRAFSAQVARLGGDPARIRYFPAWAEPVLQTRDATLAPEMEPHRDHFTILFAGNIGESQDFPAILDAAAELADLPQVRWLVVGDGRAAGWVRAEIQRRDLAGRVRLLGQYPLDRMPSFYRGARALLVTLKPHPAMAMTIPGKVQGCLAAGLPILAMLDGEGARILAEAGALVAPSGQGRTLATQVRQLVAMPESERQALGQRCRDYCEREFGRERLLRSLETWMEELRPESRS